MPDYVPPPLPPSNPPRRRLGCFAQGCLITVVIVMLLGVLFGSVGWLLVKSGQSYVTTHPVPPRAAAATDEQYQALLAKLQPFGEALNAGHAATAELSADDLNTLLAHTPSLASLRDVVSFDIVQNQLVADLNVPLHDADPSAQHFISARVTCDASFAADRFALALRKVEPLDGEAKSGLMASALSNPQFLQSYSQVFTRDLNANFRREVRKDPQLVEILSRIRTAVLQNNHVVVTSVERPNAAPLSPASPVATPAKTE